MCGPHDASALQLACPQAHTHLASQLVATVQQRAAAAHMQVVQSTSGAMTSQPAKAQRPRRSFEAPSAVGAGADPGVLDIVPPQLSAPAPPLASPRGGVAATVLQQLQAAPPTIVPALSQPGARLSRAERAASDDRLSFDTRDDDVEALREQLQGAALGGAAACGSGGSSSSGGSAAGDDECAGAGGAAGPARPQPRRSFATQQRRFCPSCPDIPELYAVSAAQRGRTSWSTTDVRKASAADGGIVAPAASTAPCERGAAAPLLSTSALFTQANLPSHHGSSSGSYSAPEACLVGQDRPEGAQRQSARRRIVPGDHGSSTEAAGRLQAWQVRAMLASAHSSSVQGSRTLPHSVDLRPAC
jgi:hypothetical protein